ncbi:MAG: hypothetical protein KAI70_01235 [Candidatus Omnitrophica bacterium]|nr:hypothetical protein [Candidatus Omnitrophota bacterium]
MEGCIASPHWEACNTCEHYGDDGCNLSYFDLTVYDEYWILCDDYVKKEENESRDPEKSVNEI